MTKTRIILVSSLIFISMVLWKFTIEVSSMETFRYQDPELLGSIQLPDPDNYSWIIYAEELAANPAWDRKADWVQGQESRYVYWAKYPLMWTLGTAGQLYSKVTGESLRYSLESVLPFVYTTLFVIMGLLILTYSILLYGTIGAAGGLLYLLSPFILQIWEPFRIDHHGLISGLGYLGVMGLLRASETREMKDSIISGISFGLIAWISFLNFIPIAVVVGTAVIVYEIYSKVKGQCSVLPPKTYIVTGGIITIMTLLAYAIEYGTLPFTYEYANPMFALFTFSTSVVLYIFTKADNLQQLTSISNNKVNTILLIAGTSVQVLIVAHIYSSRLLFVFDSHFGRIMHLISENLPVHYSSEFLIVPILTVLTFWTIYARKGMTVLYLFLLILASITIIMALSSYRDAVIMMAVSIPCFIKLTTQSTRWVLFAGLAITAYFLVSKGLNEQRFGKTYQHSNSQLMLMREINKLENRPRLIAADPSIATSIYYFTGLPVYTNLYLESKDSLVEFMGVLAEENSEISKFAITKGIDTLILDPGQFAFYYYASLGKIGLFPQEGILSSQELPNFEKIEHKSHYLIFKNTKKP